jgi:phage gp36-like protein
MAYCTSDEIQGAIGGAAALKALTDPANATTNSTAVTSAIEFASAVIDQWAIGTPDTGTPIQAKHCAISIAVYRLYELIRREAPKTIADAYARAMEMLKALAEGRTSWVPAEPAAVQNTGTVWFFSAGSTARDDNPRRTRRDQLDAL